MSTSVEITLTGPGRPEEAALEAAASAAGLDPDQVIAAPGSERAVICFWDRKWGVDGADTFAQQLSAAHPDLLVKLERTWDGRDEDEPGGTGTTWRAGNITRRGEIRWVWTDQA